MVRLWFLFGALFPVLACSGDGGVASCLTNGDCESRCCVNGRCVPLMEEPDATVDAGAVDADMDGSDVAPRCVPWTCETLGQTCRGASDGCGATLECGTPGSTVHYPIEWGGNQYVNWRFVDGAAQERIEHELCFDEVPSSANGFGRGMFFQVYDGAIDGQGYYVGYQDRVGGVGVMRTTPGAIFTKFGDRDVDHLRPGPASVVVSDESAGFISLRMALPLEVGCYTTTLLRGAPDNGGDWVIVRIEADGVGYQLGEIWFERTEADAPIRLPNNGGSWVEFFGFAGRTSDEVPRYDLRMSVLGDGAPPISMRARYHRLGPENSSTEYLVESDEVRMLVGGDTFRCVPGTLAGDFYETRWDASR